jgi:hypothetical protein
MFDPGKDRPAIALVLQARQGLQRELSSSAEHLTLFALRNP